MGAKLSNGLLLNQQKYSDMCHNFGFLLFQFGDYYESILKANF